MKIILISVITANLLFSSSLENSLISTDFKQVETKKIKYYVVRKRERTTEMKAGISTLETNAAIMSSEYSKAVSSINKYTAGIKDSYKKDIKNIKTNKNEIIVLKHLEIPRLYKEHGLREKVIVSFEIDKNKNVSKITYEKESNYPEINRKIKQAIIDSRYELITNNKSKITLYYDFQI